MSRLAQRENRYEDQIAWDRLRHEWSPEDETQSAPAYGDYDHEHFHEPDDAANLVEAANRISAAVQRPIQWLHLSVPIDCGGAQDGIQTLLRTHAEASAPVRE